MSQEITKADHCVINMRTGLLECQHCEATTALDTPMSVEAFVKFVDYWNTRHKRCVKPATT